MSTCRLLPQGAYTLYPAALTTMAWIAALFQDGCDYSRLTGPLVAELALNPDAPWIEVGFGAYRSPLYNEKTGAWQVQYSAVCLEYPSEIITPDGYWKVSKGFDFLALVFGGGATFFLWFSTCCVFSSGTWRWAGYQVLLAAIFQAFAFLWLKNDICQGENNCELFMGSKSDIIATVFWTVAALLIFCKYPKPREESGGDGIVVDELRGSRRNGYRPTSGETGEREPAWVTPARDTDFCISDDNDDKMDDVVMSSGEDSGERPSRANIV